MRISKFFDILYRDIEDGSNCALDIRGLNTEGKVVLKKDMDPDSLNEYLRRKPVATQYINYFFGVAPRGFVIDKGVAKLDRTKKGVKFLTSLWCDIDFKQIQQDHNCDAERAKEIVGKKLKNFKLKPTIIIHSGGGLHCYWKLKGVKNSIKDVENFNKRLAVYLGADLAATDASRILRIPETWNFKYDPPRKVKIVTMNDDREYSLDDFEFLPEVRRQTEAPEGWEDGGFITEAYSKKYEPQHRNDVVVDVCKYYANHLPPQDVLFHVWKFVKECVHQDEEQYSYDDIKRRVEWALAHRRVFKTQNVMAYDKKNRRYCVEIWLPENFIKIMEETTVG